MDKTRIIVVEDNIVYCEFVCNLLAREGFRTVQAYHLSTAKKLLQQASDGDIVVSDLRLPDGDGIDLLRCGGQGTHLTRVEAGKRKPQGCRRIARNRTYNAV